MTLVLIRHGKAGNRDRWDGPDRDRPLTERGHDQAEAIAGLLADDPVDRVLSSPYLRCRQTVGPIAKRRDLEIDISEQLAEGASESSVLALLETLAAEDTNAVLCSHGDVIPTIIDRLYRTLGIRAAVPCAKGSLWVIQTTDRKLGEPRYIDPPQLV